MPGPLAPFTAQSLITAAMVRNNSCGWGRTPAPEQLAAALPTLTRMTDLWSIDSINIYQERIDVYTLTNQQQKYTIGIDPAGVLVPNLVGPRPIRIVRANVLFPGSPSVRRSIRLLSDRDWAAKSLQLVYSIPFELFNDAAWPLSNLYFYPAPDAAYQIELFTWQQLTNFSALTDVVSFPPGYEEAIICNLAVRLALDFGRKVNPELLVLASQSKASIQSLNSPKLRLRTDPALRPHGGGYYNYRTGLVE